MDNGIKNPNGKPVSPINGQPVPDPGPGRPKGMPNKSTVAAREAIARFVDGNAERLQEWLDQIAKESPEKAFNCVKDLLEYHVPKLARTDIQNLDKDGKPADPPTVRVEIVKSGD
jgi:hypothetical protein